MFRKLQSSPASAEQLLKCLVKFFLDLSEFFGELFPHSLIQLLNDLFQRFFRFQKIVVLAA